MSVPNDPPGNNPPTPPNPPMPPGGGSEGMGNGGNAQKIAHNPTSARIPEKVARGVTATATLVFMGPNEFIVDFLQFLARPPQLAARVIMSPPVAENFLAGLRENLMRYEQAYGKPQVIPKVQGEKPRSAQDLYDDLKLPEDLLTGVYVNGFLIGHSPAEFGIDFITNFFPSAVVTARVYLAVPRVAQLVETLGNMVGQWQKQRQQVVMFGQGPGNGPTPPLAGPGGGGSGGGPGNGPGGNGGGGPSSGNGGNGGGGSGPMPNIPPAGGPGWPTF